MHVDALTHQIIGAAMRVHSRVGPGLLESSYEACLKYELMKLGLKVSAQVGLPLVYDDVHLDVGYRIDLLVQDQIIVEIKAQESILPVHEAQLLSHLRLSRRKVGLLINFHVTRLKNGIKRMVDDFPEGGFDVDSSESAVSAALAVARRPRR
jgi:GxxExxY protein